MVLERRADCQSLTERDWSHSPRQDGGTATIDNTLPHGPKGRVLALRFKPDGGIGTFDAPPTQLRPRTAWRIHRRRRSDGSISVTQQLDDTPLYQRAMLQSTLLGKTVSCFHETRKVPRLVSPVLQAILP